MPAGSDYTLMVKDQGNSIAVNIMVCCPCFVIPFLLWVFHKFISPWLSKFWSKPNEIAQNVENNLTCPLPKKKKPKDSQQANGHTVEDTDSSSTQLNGHSNLGERLKAE